METATVARTRHRISVLVVEDSMDHRMLMERRLRDAGMEVVAAATGEEALASFADVDLVLLDYRLPKFSGLEILRKIREVSGGPSVVMVTGMGLTDVAVEAMREGAIDYLAKNPGYLQALPNVVERAWRHHDLARRAGELQRLALLVNSATARADVFKEIVVGAVRLLEADACVLLIAGENDKLAVAATTDGVSTDVLDQLASASATSIPTEGEPRFSDGRIDVGLPEEDGRQIGMLSMLVPPGAQFLSEELNLAQAFASFAGIALKNLRRRELEEALIAELQQTIEARRDFVASVSHELRTPLQSIWGYTETVLGRWDAIDRETKLTFLEKVKVHSVELKDIVEQLIDIAGIERGRTVRAELQESSLAAEVERSVESIELLLEGRELRVDVTDARIKCDPDLFRRVLTNYLSNAAKFSEPGTAIDVVARPDDGATWARIEVTDQGIGLHPREAARVFEAFFRASYSVANAVRGSGIGLSLVKEYVRSMDGDFGVESEPGEGATFWFTVPLAG